MDRRRAAKETGKTIRDAWLPRIHTMSAAATVVITALVTPSASATIRLRAISSDRYSNAESFHRTEVEPDTFAYGSTIVATFQAGRIFDGGSANIGWATSQNGGRSWHHGFLPGTTAVATPPGPYARISDPSVAYDAKHSTWLIATLAIDNQSPGEAHGAGVLVNASTTGGRSWGLPVAVATTTTVDADKSWIACDNTAASSFFGHCYVEWDDFGAVQRLRVAYSDDGGNTWQASTTPTTSVIGGQPLVQPGGKVIMPIVSGASIVSFVSNDGGASFSGPYPIGDANVSGTSGNLRGGGPLPSAALDAAGTVYVVWRSCSFEPACSTSDLVMSTSTDGVTWSGVVRIPIDPVAGGVDHLIPGIGVDPTTSGSTAKVGLAYYYYPTANCDEGSCELQVGFVSSLDGGQNWTPAIHLAGPMQPTTLPLTNQGHMVGDYISTSVVAGRAYPAFAVATRESCSPIGIGGVPPAGRPCNERIVVPRGGLPLTP
jgi:hypothetical protein